MTINKQDIDSKKLKYYYINPVNLTDREYINISIQRIVYPNLSGTIHQFIALLALRDLNNSYFQLNKDSFKQFSKWIMVIPESLKKHIYRLVNHYRIVSNTKIEYYQIISLEQISQKSKLNSWATLIFFAIDFHKYKVFVYHLIITYFMKVPKGKTYKKNRKIFKPVCKKENSRMNLTANISSSIINIPKQYKSIQITFKLICKIEISNHVHLLTIE